MNCEICNNPTNGTATCCYEHGIDWRFLKKFELTKQEINEIRAIKTGLSIKYKYFIWKKGLSETPKCVICEHELSKKKILSFAPSSSCCSKCCYSEYKKRNKNISGIIIRELRKQTNDVDGYIEALKEKYPKHTDILLMNKLHIHGLDDLPKCYFCGSPHSKITNISIQKTCNNKCHQAYAPNEKSYNDMLSHYINKGISVEFLSGIDKYDLCKIFNNKKRDIIQCGCGKTVIDKCVVCVNKKHFNNLSSFNEKTFRTFIKNGLFDVKSAMDYYNCSESTIRRQMKDFGIENRCRYTVEDDVIDSIGISPLSRNDRTLIWPKEIDILYDGFGVEYNGLIWHSEGNSEHPQFNRDGLSDMHLEKTLMCESKGIQLFHIFENEWYDPIKRKIWISIIRSRAQQINNQYYEAHEITKEVSRVYENNNHLQGYIESDIRIGLFQDGEMCGVMTFSDNGEGNYSVNSYCTTVGIEGGTILLAYFKKIYEPLSIIGFADRRWDNGEFLEQLGFEFICDINPKHYYFKDWKENGLLSGEYDSEYMFKNGYRRIYDCGQKKYINRR